MHRRHAGRGGIARCKYEIVNPCEHILPVHARSCRNPEGDDERDTPPDPEKRGVKRAMYRLNTSRPKVVQVRDYSEKQVQTLREPGDELTTTLNRLKEFDHEEDRRPNG